jgi:hypothetical protein
VGIITSTHFAKPKLEQKYNSLHAKNSNMPKYITVALTKIRKKNPFNFPREDFKFIKKWWGSLKK